MKKDEIKKVAKKHKIKKRERHFTHEQVWGDEEVAFTLLRKIAEAYLYRQMAIAGWLAALIVSVGFVAHAIYVYQFLIK